MAYDETIPERILMLDAIACIVQTIVEGIVLIVALLVSPFVDRGKN